MKIKEKQTKVEKREKFTCYSYKNYIRSTMITEVKHLELSQS